MFGEPSDPPPKAFNLARYCLAGAARQHPDKIALTVATTADGSTPDEIWTFGALESGVLAIAAGLRAYDLPPGSRIFIRMGNSVDFALVFFGAVAAGHIPIPGSSQLSISEVDFMVADAGAAAVAHSSDMPLPDLADDVLRIGPDELAKLKATPPVTYADTKADDPAFLIYTSGTSGTPKGVLHAQRAVWGRRPMYEGWYGLGEDDVVLHTGAFNWTYTLGTGMFDPWANGAATVLYTGEKDITVWPKLIARSGATIIASVPTLYRQLLKYTDIDRSSIGRLRHGLTAGEPLPQSTVEAWLGATGLILYEALGMSEISTYVSTAPGIPVKAGSPGRPQEGRRVAILPIDDADATEPCGPNVTGLLAVHRSDPGLMLRYWNESDGDADAFRGEWFCGGDVGYLDEDGYFWFEGRNNDIMNAFGYRVSPVEVETVIAQHPDVAEVAVTEAQVREDVSVIAAFVVPREPGARIDADDIITFASEKLATYKVPKSVFAIDELPRTANGKVMRRELRVPAHHPG